MPMPVELMIRDTATGHNRVLEDDDLAGLGGGGGGDASAANQTTIIASLAVLDDWDESDRAKVNPIAGQAGVQGGAGNVTALTQRVVLATDQAALTTPLPVDPGQSVMAAAADATGTDKHRWTAASVAAALTGAAVKASSGVIYGYHIANLHATTAIWVHYYDATSATGTPEMSLYVPGGSVLDHPSIGAPVGGWGTGIWVSASANYDGTGEPAAVPYVLTLYK